MVKAKELILSGLISILPAGLILLNILDLINVFKGEGEYPFGSEFVTAYSVYASKEIYVSYTLVFTLDLLLTIYFTFKRKRKLCMVFLFLGTNSRVSSGEFKMVRFTV